MAHTQSMTNTLAHLLYVSKSLGLCTEPTVTSFVEILGGKLVLKFTAIVPRVLFKYFNSCNTQLLGWKCPYDISNVENICYMYISVRVNLASSPGLDSGFHSMVLLTAIKQHSLEKWQCHQVHWHLLNHRQASGRSCSVWLTRSNEDVTNSKGLCSLSGKA